MNIINRIVIPICSDVNVPPWITFVWIFIKIVIDNICEMDNSIASLFCRKQLHSLYGLVIVICQIVTAYWQEYQEQAEEPTHSDYSCCVSLIVITHCAIFLNAYNGFICWKIKHQRIFNADSKFPRKNKRSIYSVVHRSIPYKIQLNYHTANLTPIRWGHPAASNLLRFQVSFSVCFAERWQALAVLR